MKHIFKIIFFMMLATNVNAETNIVEIIGAGWLKTFTNRVELFVGRNYLQIGHIPKELDGNILVYTAMSNTRVKFLEDRHVWILCRLKQGRKKNKIPLMTHVEKAKAQGFSQSDISDFSLYGRQWGIVRVLEKDVKKGELLEFGDWVRLIIEGDLIPKSKNKEKNKGKLKIKYYKINHVGDNRTHTYKLSEGDLSMVRIDGSREIRSLRFKVNYYKEGSVLSFTEYLEDGTWVKYNLDLGSKKISGSWQNSKGKRGKCSVIKGGKDK